MADEVRSETPPFGRSVITGLKNLFAGPKKPAAAGAKSLDTFCVHPWMHFRVQTGGEGAVCCRYKTNISKDGAPLSLHKDSFDAIWNSEEMRNVRRAMVAGQRVAGCAECYAEEKDGAVSMRQRDNIAWESGWLNESRLTLAQLKSAAAASDFVIPDMPANLEVEIGSLCNLRCRMCHAGVSSSIANDVVHRTWSADQYSNNRYHNPDLQVRPMGIRRWALSEALEKAIVQGRGKVKRLYFIGGEPLLVKEVGSLLQRLIDSGLARDMVLAVVSNGTVTSSWLGLTQHFKRFELALSIDGFGRHYDYIRYPSKWETLARNIETFRQLPNVSLGAAVTFQAYNALNVCDLFRHLDSIGVGFHAWPVHIPKYLSVQTMPASARRLAAERLHAYAQSDCRADYRHVVLGLVEYVKPRNDEVDPRLLREFMLFTNDLDRARSQSFAEVNPELKELLHEAGFAWTDETLHASAAETSAGKAAELVPGSA
jgi:MoaA/NifB/PqqE/SkfB family radical SAM enzyme